MTQPSSQLDPDAHQSMRPLRSIFIATGITALLLFPVSILHSRPQIIPVVNLDFLGGQFFFEGENTSFSGNGSWNVTPGIKLSDKYSILPTVKGKYQRIREVKELIGGGFLTRENFENTGSLKGIIKLNDAWKMKLKGSYRSQLLVESDDEELGKGLFDNNKLSFGLEAERTGTFLRSLRFSVDPYAVRFVNYNSLSSESQFGSEIDSGGSTLDFNAYDTMISAEIRPMQKTLLNVAGLASYRLFTDQNRVTSSGLFTDEKRKDIYVYGAVGVSQVLPKWDFARLQSMVGIDATYALLDSDQDNFDASRTQYNPGFYDYLEYSIAPKVVSRLFGKFDSAIVYNYTRRDYNHRPIQDSEGNYLKDKININTHTVSVSLKYPLAYGLSVVTQGAYRKATSNMRFERTYRYNYNAQHYFAGLSWQY